MSYTIQFKREQNYRKNQYCILEFKGKFESDYADQLSQQKSFIHLGQLKNLGNGKFKLQIGVMDLVGRQVPVDNHQIMTEMLNQNNNTKIIIAKGIITKKIIFQNRPVPDMERASIINKRQSMGNKMFLKMEEKQPITSQENN